MLDDDESENLEDLQLEKENQTSSSWMAMKGLVAPTNVNTAIYLDPQSTAKILKKNDDTFKNDLLVCALNVV